MPGLLRRALVALAVLTAVGRLAAAQTPGGALILRNGQWEAVRVEVRIGSSTDCAANAAVGARTLRRTQRWAVVTTEVVCWRREQVPGEPGRGWTAWRAERVPAATRREVDL